MKYTLSFTIDTDADPCDLLDQLTDYAEQLVDSLDPGEDWYGNEIPATLDTTDNLSPSVAEVA